MLFAYLFNKEPDKSKNINYIFTKSLDYGSYTTPSSNLVDHGEYYESHKGKKLYAHKMPGMLPIFAPLYSVFGWNWGLTVLVVLQFITDALCCVLLGLIAQKLFKSNVAFYSAFYVYAFSTIVSIGSHHAVSELFCTSFLIISVYFCLSNQRGNWLLSGLFAAWSIFFRPTSILLLAFLPLLWLMHNNKGLNIKQLGLKNLLWFLLPFTVAETAWIIRNEITLKRFIPHDICVENAAPARTLSLFEFVKAFGGDLQGWNDDSPVNWFDPDIIKDSVELERTALIFFPSYVWESGITLEDLKKLRRKYLQYNDKTPTEEEIAIHSSEFDQMTQVLIEKFKAGAPFHYYIVAPLRVVNTLVFIKRPYGFSFSHSGILVKALRLWHFLCYYIALLLFFAGAVWVGMSNKSTLILALLVVTHILLYGFIFRYSENRYLVPVYPFAILVGTAFLCKISEALKPWLNKGKLANDA